MGIVIYLYKTLGRNYILLIMKKIIQVMNNVWQFPQNILGFLYLKSHRRDIVSTMNSDIWNCRIYLTKNVSNIAIGDKVFVYHRVSNLPIMVNHLIGHTLLSKKWGPLYMPAIGAPSFIWSEFCRVVNANKIYVDFCSFYTEVLADFEFAESIKK
jgi:hypothetical protein